MADDRVRAGLWEPVDPKNERIEAGVAQLPRVFWGRPEIWGEFLALIDDTASHPETWSFLSEMVNATKAKVIVEAGSYRGHALFAMAEALWSSNQEAHIYSADLVDHHVGDALNELGLGGYVSLGIGDFRRMVEQHVTKPIDLAFVDASDPNNALLRLQLVDFLLPRMREGGLVIVDDCESDGWAGARTMRAMCDLYLPLGRGTCVFQA